MIRQRGSQENRGKDEFMSIQKHEKWSRITRIGVRAMTIILVLALTVLAALMMIAELTVA